MGFLQVQLEDKFDLLKKEIPALPDRVDVDVRNVLGAIGRYLQGEKYEPCYTYFLHHDHIYRLFGMTDEQEPYVQQVYHLGYACAFIAAGEALGEYHNTYYQLQHEAQYWLSL